MDAIFQAGKHVSDLFEDFRDGHNLISLLEVLSGQILVSCHTPLFVLWLCVSWFA